jgi:hypothetical protein
MKFAIGEMAVVVHKCGDPTCEVLKYVGTVCEIVAQNVPVRSPFVAIILGSMCWDYEIRLCDGELSLCLEDNLRKLEPPKTEETTEESQELENVHR